MKFTKYLSVFLATVIMSSMLPTGIFAETDDKEKRTVYLHANGADYQGKSASSTVYMGDTAEVFFAVDNPNKGDYISADDPRNDSILDDIAAATADVVAKYEEKVLTTSEDAVSLLVDEITSWYYMSSGKDKDKLAEKINNSAYKDFMTKELYKLTDDDFEDDKLKPQSVLEQFDESKYDDIYRYLYSGEYDNQYTYRYEYEYFYLGKVENKVKEAESAISEYNKKIAQTADDIDKDVLKSTLLGKLNADGLDFIEVSDDYSVSFDEDAFRVYTREKMHKERVVSGGAYFVGKDAEEDIRHIEPAYDLNGYTVKIYYDPAYFDLADSKNPLNYNASGMYTTETKDENLDDVTEETPLDNGLWVYKMETFPAKNGYASVAATIFASGIYFPNKPEDKAWYNLCSLALIPKKTGRTQVYIERPGIDKDYPLTLFAKHNPKADRSFNPTFNITSQNSGYHTITISDKFLPSAPVANPASGTYTEHTDVTLEGDADCTIYYKRSGDTTWTVYSYPDQDPSTIVPIAIDYTQSIVCKAVRTKGIADEEERYESREVQYDYTIVPNPPYLWENDTTIINSQLYKDDVFEVYPSHSNTHYEGNIDNSKMFYYTFNEDLLVEDVPDGSDISAELTNDPETQWRRLPNNSPAIEITENVKLRMVARMNDTYSSTPVYSDISEYMLGIKPGYAYDPEYSEGEIYSGVHYVTLTTSNGYPVEIYYTLDGSNPVTNGMLYTGEIILAKSTEIRTVAKIPGEDIYSDVMSFVYDFSGVPADLVEAFYPAGTYVGSASVVLKANSFDYPIEYCIKEGSYDKSFTPDDADFESYSNQNIAVTENLTIYAKTTYPGSDETVYAFPYVIKPMEPIFAPKSQQFVDAGSVDISAAIEDSDDVEYTLYYTTDGSDPTDEHNPNRIMATGEHDSANIPVGTNMVIKATVYADYGEYSKVVTHEYQIINNKPKKPVVTLEEGTYLKKNSDTEPLTTRFAEVSELTSIYYTVSYDGEDIAIPYPGEEGTYLYDYDLATEENPIPIPIKGKTVIKAVAIDENGVRSDIGTFVYNVVPEAPTSAPSGDSASLFVMPVNTIAGANVTYTLTDENDEPHEVYVELPDGVSTFYINNEDGLPYFDEECSNPIPTTASPVVLEGTTVLELMSEVDGVASDVRTYTYTVNPSVTKLLPPYADKPEGLYEEVKQEDGNYVLNVKLYSKTNGATIEWRDVTGREANDDTGWTTYDESDGGIKLKKGTLLQCRTRLSVTEVSDAVTYVYMFKPMAPIIRMKSGNYTEVIDNHIEYNSARPEDEDDFYEYKIQWRRRVGENEYPYVDYEMPSFSLSESSFVMAYVINEATGVISDVVSSHYIIKKADTNSYVKVRAPYDVSSLDREKLSTGEYAKGIHLDLLIGNYTTHYVKYKYTYKLKDDDTVHSTSWNIYDVDMPILANASMEYIIIEAQVFKNDGYAFSPYTHRIDFTDAPKTKPSGGSGGGGGGGSSFTRKTYTKDIFGVEHITHIGYISGYTDGSVRPENNITREETAAILYRIYSKKYETPFVLTGEVFPDVAKDRWSATDIEYMTEKEVISGYPDGSFKPEQNITRAEFATLVRRLAKLEANSFENKFTDLNEEHWAFDNIMALCEAGLMVGYDETTFAPDNQITRAEVIVVINKLLGRNPSESYVKNLAIQPFNDLSKKKWYYVAVMEATITHDYTLNFNKVEIEWENFK